MLNLPRSVARLERVEIPLADKMAGGKERSWRVFKLFNEILSETLWDLEYEKLAERVEGCGNYLNFLECEESVAHPKKLAGASFCGNRLCETCQWRKSLKQFAVAMNIAQVALQIHPSLKFIFLTLTVPNVGLRELSEELTHIFESWSRLSRRKEFKRAVKGYFRALEISYNHKREDYHPHIHAVLAVPSHYFKTEAYITHGRWLELWQQSTRMPEIKSVNVKKMRNRKGEESESVEEMALLFAEVTKYPLKTWSTESRNSTRRLMKLPEVRREDLEGHIWIRRSREETAEVVKGLLSALENRHLVSYGGMFKEIKKEMGLKDGEDEKTDLVNISGEKTGCRCNQCGGCMVEKLYSWCCRRKNYFGCY